MDGVLERLVKLEHTVYYKYAEDTLKSLNNNTNRLLSLYGVTEEKILFEGRANKLRGYFAKTGETAAVTAATKGANIWVRIAIGSAYFFKDIGDEIGSVKLSTTKCPYICCCCRRS